MTSDLSWNEVPKRDILAYVMFPVNMAVALICGSYVYSGPGYGDSLVKAAFRILLFLITVFELYVAVRYPRLEVIPTERFLLVRNLFKTYKIPYEDIREIALGYNNRRPGPRLLYSVNSKSKKLYIFALQRSSGREYSVRMIINALQSEINGKLHKS